MATEQLQRPIEETIHHEEHQHVSHEQLFEQKTPQPPPTHALGSANVGHSTTKSHQMVMPNSASPCCGGHANSGHQTHEHETHKASHVLAQVRSVGQHAHSKSDKKMTDKKEKKEGKCEDKKKTKEKKSEHAKKTKKKSGKKSSKDDTSSSSDSD